MKIATTLSSSPPRAFHACKESVTAFCWHSYLDEAFVASKGLRIYRVNADTSAVLGPSWTISNSPTNDLVEEEGLSSKPEEEDGEFIASLLCSSRAGEVSGKHACLIAITSKSRMFMWDVTEETAVPMGEAVVKLAADPSTLSVTQNLPMSALIGLSSMRSPHVSMALLDPRAAHKKKLGTVFSIEPKFTKQLKKPHPTSVSACPGLSALALGTSEGTLQVWRYASSDILKNDGDEHVEASSYVVSAPLKTKEANSGGGFGCISWANHNENTKLIITHEVNAPQAVVWAWSADFGKDTDGGSLRQVRFISTLHPNGIVAVHPHLSAMLVLSKLETDSVMSSHLSLIDLETGLANGEHQLLQKRTISMIARPPLQSKPKPPPSSSSKSSSTGNINFSSMNAKSGEGDVQNGGQKRRRSRFSFIPSLKRKPKQAMDISAPLPASPDATTGTGGDSQQQQQNEHESGSRFVDIFSGIFISPVSGSVVILTNSMEPNAQPHSIFAREVTFSLETSFLGSAAVPLVSFPNQKRCLYVDSIPQDLSQLPMDANGAPMQEIALVRTRNPFMGQRLLKVGDEDVIILKRAQTSAITVVGIEQRAQGEEIIVRAVGHVCLLPFFGYSRTATFEPATDACFNENGGIAVLTGRSFVVIKRFDETKSVWERASMKIRLQMDARRIFSTPFGAGGKQLLFPTSPTSGVAAEQEEESTSYEGSVLLYCGLMSSSQTEFLCYSRNASESYSGEDLFMLIDDSLVVNQNVEVIQPPTPQRANIRSGHHRSTHHRNSAFEFPESSPRHRLSTSTPTNVGTTGGRSGSVFMSVKEMDELRQRNMNVITQQKAEEHVDEPKAIQESSSLNAPITLTSDAARMPRYVMERGERVLKVIWSPFSPEEDGKNLWYERPKGSPPLADLAVSTTRRLILLDKLLRVVGEVRDSPTSMSFIAPGTVAYTLLRSPDQIMVVSSIGPEAFRANPLLACPRKPGEGPLSIVSAFPGRIVIARVKDDGVRRVVGLAYRPFLNPVLSSNHSSVIKGMDSSDWAGMVRWSAFNDKSMLDETFRLKVPLKVQSLVALASKANKNSLAAIQSLKELEKRMLKTENPEHDLGSLVRMAYSDVLDDSVESESIESYLVKLNVYESSGEYWNEFRLCVKMIRSKTNNNNRSVNELGKKTLLRMARNIRGSGSSGLVQAIRAVLGSEAVNEVVPYGNNGSGAPAVEGTSPRPPGSLSRAGREDSAASLAAAAASLRSGEGSSRLRRRETLPHPSPAAPSLSTLPLSKEGYMVMETNDDVESSERVLEDSVGDGNEPFVNALEENKVFEDWVGGRDFFVGRTLDQSWYWTREQLETNVSLNRSSLSGNNSHLDRPQQPQKKEFVLSGVLAGGDARKFSFGGSDENAVVGYWRFEELEESAIGSRSLDLSRFNNHGILMKGADYSDSAHLCTRLEMGGRRHAHALSVNGTGGMKVPITDLSLDLGGHSNDPRSQSFTLEFWLCLERIQIDCETVLFERVAQESPWRLVVAGNEDSVESIWFESPDVVYVCTNPEREIGKMMGEWRHIALTSTHGGEICIYVDGTKLTLQKQPQTRYDGKQMVDSPDEYLQIGGEGLHGQILEMRMWAVAREQWEIAQMMETYLNLAERVPMRITTTTTSSSSTATTTNNTGSVLAPPPPPSSGGSGRKSSTASNGAPRAPSAASSSIKAGDEGEEEDSIAHPPRKKTPASTPIEKFINPFAAEDPFSQMEEEVEPSQVSFDYKDPQQLSPFTAAFGPVHHSMVDSRAIGGDSGGGIDEPSTETPFLVPTPNSQDSSNHQQGGRRHRGSTSSSVHSQQQQLQEVDALGGSSTDVAPSSTSVAKTGGEQQQQKQPDPWRKVRDEATGADYFFNVETGESVWTDPRVSASPWDAFTDEDGQVYYYNRLTGETTWDKPTELIMEDEEEGSDIEEEVEQEDDESGQ